jgi:hypothetical protein
MNRMQWKSDYRSARLGRHRGGASFAHADDDQILPGPGMRRRAAWAFVGLAMMAATLAFWRIQPSEQRGEALAVSVPAASSPAADAGPAAVQS